LGVYFLLPIFSEESYPFFNDFELEFLVKKISLLFLLMLGVAGLASCYQIHSDDDLRTIPVTNNPNIVPNHRGLPSAPM
jgi:hypothetical protein